MPHEPTLTDAQRAEWSGALLGETWTEYADRMGFPVGEATDNVLLVINAKVAKAVDERFRWLEADHARLVEECRRLAEALHAQ